MEGFIVIMFNLAHPTKDVVPSVATDSDEYQNTLVFDTEEEAQSWIDENKRMPFGYAICDLGFLEVQTY